MNTYLLLAMLAAVAAHRIWNYEDIFASPRVWLSGIKPAVCASCNAFWIPALIAAILGAAGCLSLPQAILLPFATYPFLRGAVWFYQQPWGSLVHAVIRLASSHAGNTPAPPAKPSSEGGCSSCEAKRKAIEDERKRTDSFDERVVLLTTRGLSSVLPLAQQLAAKPKRLVQIWGAPDEFGLHAHTKLPSNVEIRTYLLPKSSWNAKPNSVHDEAMTKAMALTFRDKLMWLGSATVITDGLIATPSAAVVSAAAFRAAELAAFKWVHYAGGGQSFLEHGAQPLPPFHAVLLDTAEQVVSLRKLAHYELVGALPDLEVLLAEVKPVPVPAAVAP